MIAALFLRGPVTCRSRQLYERLICPPTNHFAHGQFHSSTLSHFLNQCSSSAMRPQNFSGSSTDSLYICSYSARLLMCAARLNSAGGSNLRCSCRMESMLVDCASTTLSAMCNLGYWSRNRARDSEKHSTHEPDLLSAHRLENRPTKLLMR